MNDLETELRALRAQLREAQADHAHACLTLERAEDRVRHYRAAVEQAESALYATDHHG